MLDFGRWTLDRGERSVSYKSLAIYKLSYEMALQVHHLTMKFPKHETYELGSQMRRAAVSIVLNIVEGYGRKTHQQDFKNFLINALGSCNETTVLIQLTKDLGYISLEESVELEKQYDQLGRQINKFVETLKSKI